jgi:hypothetical protein
MWYSRTTFAAALVAAAIPPSANVHAFSSTLPSPFGAVSSATSTASSWSSQLYNIPPQAIDEADPQTMKDAADRAAPPQNFFILQKNSVTAAQLAVKDGHKRLEVEVSVWLRKSSCTYEWYLLLN